MISNAYPAPSRDQTNGTAINDKRVEKGERRLLANGDRFRIGLDVVALFLLPPSLYERMRGG